MRFVPLIIAVAAIVFTFFLNILGLMKMAPLFITSPLLFITILVTIYLVSHRKTFKGF
ncbi:hypothetical protein IC621_22965 [Bacillus sp. IB182487]|uniref:Uncharacterized protein n=1 Tax=Metabacillus arenae TaxID=2771434 RepID=A0A926NM01_9BACI|nr:hypothetical protein [Metabacillus arenae]MBD1383068.1 hypothetical protein [Metabacillus arenae]